MNPSLTHSVAITGADEVLDSQCGAGDGAHPESLAEAGARYAYTVFRTSTTLVRPNLRTTIATTATSTKNTAITVRKPRCSSITPCTTGDVVMVRIR